MLAATAWLMLAMPILCRYYSPTWQAYYGYVAEQLQGALARSGEAPEAASYESGRKSFGVAESRLRFFYGTFTRLLRHLYDSVQHPWYPPRSL